MTSQPHDDLAKETAALTGLEQALQPHAGDHRPARGGPTHQRGYETTPKSLAESLTTPSRRELRRDGGRSACTTSPIRASLAHEGGRERALRANVRRCARTRAVSGAGPDSALL